MYKASPTDLEQRLRQVEEALEQCQRMALASRFSGAVMHEINYPLEAITNLVYLTKAHHEDSSLASENLEIVEQQLAILREVTGQAEAQDWDLVAITESALKLHADKITRHGVTVDSRFQRPAVARAFGTEILQVVSNLILNALDALPRENGRISFRVRTSKKPGRNGTSFRIILPLTSISDQIKRPTDAGLYLRRSLPICESDFDGCMLPCVFLFRFVQRFLFLANAVRPFAYRSGIDRRCCFSSRLRIVRRDI
jgi:hypothetical protein